MTFKILTYNIHKGLSGLGQTYTLEIIKEAIQKTDANICFLQEVVGQRHQLKDGHIRNQFEYLADDLWPYYSYGKNASYPQGDHGNAILSSLPILKETNFNLTVNKYEHRGLLHLQVQDPESKQLLHLLNTHLNLRHKDRVKQILSIKDYIQKFINPKDPMILSGDFNDWNFQIHKFIQMHLNLPEAHETLHSKLPKTFPSFYPMASLDRIYYRHLNVKTTSILKDQTWSKISDHLPIFAEFDL